MVRGLGASEGLGFFFLGRFVCRRTGSQQHVQAPVSPTWLDACVLQCFVDLSIGSFICTVWVSGGAWWLPKILWAWVCGCCLMAVLPLVPCPRLTAEKYYSKANVTHGKHNDDDHRWMSSWLDEFVNVNGMEKVSKALGDYQTGNQPTRMKISQSSIQKQTQLQPSTIKGSSSKLHTKVLSHDLHISLLCSSLLRLSLRACHA